MSASASLPGAVADHQRRVGPFRAVLIVVLDRGRVVDGGNHAALMANRGLYAELYGLQARAYR